MAATTVDIAVVGSVNLDQVTSVVRLPQPGETVHAVGHHEFVGGKGSNQAIAAARLGRHVAFVGLIGEDHEGTTVRQRLTQESVDLTHLGTGPWSTGRAIVLVDQDAENSIVVVGGANAELTPDRLVDATDLIARAAVVVCQLEIPVETVTAAARLARGTFVLNPAPAQVLPPELVDRIDVLVVNETEYAVVLGTALPDDHAAIAKQLAERDLTCTVVVTLGGNGAVLCHRGEVTHVNVPPVPVRDTTGAGDTFTGALADALSRGETPEQAVRWAVHAASLSVSALGATTAMPTPNQVRASLQLQQAAPVKEWRAQI